MRLTTTATNRSQANGAPKSGPVRMSNNPSQIKHEEARNTKRQARPDGQREPKETLSNGEPKHIHQEVKPMMKNLLNNIAMSLENIFSEPSARMANDRTKVYLQIGIPL